MSDRLNTPNWRRGITFAPSRVNCTPTTPTLSEALASSVNEAATVAPAVGFTNATVGGAMSLSTVTLIAEEFQAPIRLKEIVDTLAGAIIKRLSDGRRDGVGLDFLRPGAESRLLRNVKPRSVERGTAAG